MSYMTAGEYAGSELTPPPRHNKTTEPAAAVLVVHMGCEEDPGCAIDHVEAVERVLSAMPGVDVITVSWG